MEYTEDYEDYIAENNILGNVRSHNDQLYICIPRWRNGVPATLNKLANLSDGSSKLTPFPSLEANKVGNCHKALQNVAAIEIGPFGSSLWAVDSGTSAIYSRPNRKCPAKLVKINLNTKHFEVVHVFAPEIISKNSLIMHLIVDRNRFYMSDILQGELKPIMGDILKLR